MFKKSLRFIALLALAAPALHAQSWSLGAGIGPFAFGNFVERTFRLGNGGSDSTTTKTSLSAKTRPGLAVDLKRDLNSWLALDARATFVDSPLAVDGGASGGVGLDAGHVNVTTFSAPLVISLNRNATFRFHIMGGPAYAMYKIRRRTGDPLPAGIYSGTRSRWGATAGAGVDWWLSPRFAFAGEIADLVTSSPFERTDYPAGTVGLHIKRPHNIHTTGGIRYRF